MLGGGVIVQRFGDLERGRRSTEKRLEKEHGCADASGYAGRFESGAAKADFGWHHRDDSRLDKIAPGTANDDTLLYGVEVKFYNMEVELDEHLGVQSPGDYISSETAAA